MFSQSSSLKSLSPKIILFIKMNMMLGRSQLSRGFAFLGQVHYKCFYVIFFGNTQFKILSKTKKTSNFSFLFVELILLDHFIIISSLFLFFLIF